jgi:hypothetical protein
LRLRRESLIATPAAFHNVLARRVCISEGRLNQQQRRSGEEQKVFMTFSRPLRKIFELGTDAAASWRFESNDLCVLFVPLWDRSFARAAMMRETRAFNRPAVELLLVAK